MIIKLQGTFSSKEIEESLNMTAKEAAIKVAESRRHLDQISFGKVLSGDSNLVKEGAQDMSNYLQLRVREASVADRILPSDPISKNELTRTVDQNTGEAELVVQKEIEIDGFASVGHRRGYLASYEIKQKFLEFTSAIVETNKMHKTARELEVAISPTTKILEENLIKEMGDQKDKYFKGLVDACLDYTEEIGQSHVIERSGPLVPEYIGDLCISLKDPRGNLYPSSIILITMEDFIKYSSQKDNAHFGDAVQAEVSVRGWTYKTIFGRDYIITNKNDVFEPGEIYAFAPVNSSGNFLGYNYLYKDIEFMVETEFKNFTFMGSTEFFMCIANGFGVSKLRLIP